MSKRKTIDVVAMIDSHESMSKAILENYAPNQRNSRLEALNVFLESFLHETGNYKGFAYLEAGERPNPEARRYFK